MLDRRKEERSPSYLGGKITTGRRLVAFDCVVRNTSGGGARLVLSHTTLLPDEFELHIPLRNTACRVRACWRDEHHVGVQVVPLEARQAPISFAQARRIKRLQEENSRLKRLLGEGW
jgi:hypothetical protein